jgi:hypothetical protein
MRTAAPVLRIVPEELRARVHAQLKGRTAQFTGSRAYCESRYLLSGLAQCALCGGRFASQSRTHGQQLVKFYACTSHWKRGREVCGNGLAGRMDLIDAEVLATLRDRSRAMPRAAAPCSRHYWSDRSGSPRTSTTDGGGIGSVVRSPSIGSSPV